MSGTHSRIASCILATVASLLLVGTPIAALAASQTVSIQNFRFVPQSVTINAGDSITWTNFDDVVHSAKSTTGAFDTGFLQTGQSKTVIFSSAGSFPYICGVHGSSMSGTITVLAAVTPSPTVAPTPPPTAAPTPPPTVAPTPQPTIAPTPAPTAAPTSAPTVAPTSAPTTAPTPAPTAALTPTPTASPSPSANASPSPRASLLIVTAASPTASGVVTSTAASRDDGSGPGPVVVGIAVIAVTGLGALAFVLARRGP